MKFEILAIGVGISLRNEDKLACLGYYIMSREKLIRWKFFI